MSKITVILNGENKVLDENICVADLVKNLELDIKKIAIELNLEIIQLKDFGDKILKDGDKIEIVHFIGGG